MIRKGIPALVLAPMEGVTDAPMRYFMARFGSFTYFVTEFIRISQSIPKVKTLQRLVPELNPLGHKLHSGMVQVQLLGGNPELMALAAHRAVAAGAKAVDINFGCPAPTVNRNEGGAVLLQFPNRIESIVSQVRAAVPKHIPVSAKIRLGWQDPSESRVIAEKVAQGGASWITIHARTKADGYKPPALWHYITPLVKELDPLPIVANGDIWTEEDFLRCRETTGCEHFMIGRPALADPYLSHKISNKLDLYSIKTLNDYPKAEPYSDYFSKAVANCLIQYSQVLDLFGYNSHSNLTRLKQWVSILNKRWPQHWITAFRSLVNINDAILFLKNQIGNVDLQIESIKK